MAYSKITVYPFRPVEKGFLQPDVTEEPIYLVIIQQQFNGRAFVPVIKYFGLDCIDALPGDG